MFPLKHLILSAICMALLASAPARANSPAQLVSLINAYRSAPGSCAGSPANAAGPLTPQRALAGVRIGPGTFLEHALDQAGYASMHAEAINVIGPPDPEAVMELIEKNYCKTLLRAEFTDVGAARTGDAWQIILAQPVPAFTLADWKEAGKTILEAVNYARATPRTCGDRQFPAALPLEWNDRLSEAALLHSREMAKRKSLGHRGNNGSQAGDRALKLHYSWQRIGENIASGQRTPEEAVSGWLSSPGHCSNIMNASFTEMGAAYAINPDTRLGTVYWTQVFGKPR